MATTFPNRSTDVLVPEDVRHFLFDRTVQDNDLDLDLAFSDDEIARAMGHAAATYNDTQPRIARADVSPDRLPNGSLFRYGAAYHLYLSKLQQLMRNDFDYQAGNVTVELNKRRIEHLKQLVKSFGDEFKTLAREHKVLINLEQVYRAF